MYLHAHLATMSGFIQIQEKAVDFEGLLCLGFSGGFCLLVVFFGGLMWVVWWFFFFFFESSRTSWRQKPLAC